MSWRELAEGMLGTAIVSARPLSGGCISEVHRLELDDGRACAGLCAGLCRGGVCTGCELKGVGDAVVGVM